MMVLDCRPTDLQMIVIQEPIPILEDTPIARARMACTIMPIEVESEFRLNSAIKFESEPAIFPSSNSPIKKPRKSLVKVSF